MKRFVGHGIILIALLFALPAAAEIKLALDSPPDANRSGSFIWASAFIAALKESGIAVKSYPRGALGGESERLDQVSQGLLEVSMSAVKSAGAADKLVFGVYLPYLFDGVEHFDRAVGQAKLLRLINERIAPQGLKLLAFIMVGPATGIFNTKKPIRRVGDLKGLRMRALDESQIALFKAWRTTGTIVSWKEVANALQTGVADGYVNPAFVPIMFGHTDFIKYFTDARITVSTRIALASASWYDGLDRTGRQAVDRAVLRANRVNRAWLKKAEVGMLSALKAKGVTVDTLAAKDRSEFEALSKQVYHSGVLSEAEAAIWLKAAERAR